jgi:hypothetical protein
MRPLIVAEPMFRAPRPEMLSESTLMAGVWGCAKACAEATIITASANREKIELLFIAMIFPLLWSVAVFVGGPSRTLGAAESTAEV